ncbi:dipeptide ABC transporter ATP-binding protein [Phytoactinopolyspora mesophila]|uniref:Dipeptide ABC transporter ATP-binding protein n=1 Tax=Phytoactinopolyspora mesophila TaxID=2650750 RepID=A0A7K3LZ12_9ACTN|nr:ABC transporter ATP-binding protein [Phytoactinopolyspora mesophila]NDL56057.1 dipeptide ABC transporter ATP-binding protein [Phytoactinopolyspora mesophila]
MNREPLLRIDELQTHFFTPEGLVKAVDGVNLSVPAAKTVCVVGESGCGKSITARSVLRLVERPGEIVGGSIHWRSNGAAPVDLTSLDPDGPEIRRIRGGEIGMVFQEPMASLSPMYTIGAHLSEALRLHRDMSKEEAREASIALLRRVGIPQPERRLDSYPFQLSGGMCQRVMIAVAISCEPALLIADEPTTALDVTTQARILDLLKDLQEQNDMAMMFITHDLGVVAEIADEVVVMYLGRVAERGTAEQIFEDPKHPYTQALLRSIPTVRGSGERGRLNAIRGMVPHPLQRPAGCPFRTRCDHAIAGVCDTSSPPAVSFDAQQVAYCHLYSDDVFSGDVQSGAAGHPLIPLEPTAPGPSARTTPVATIPDRASAPGPQSSLPLLSVRGLTKHYPIGGGMFRAPTGTVQAVDAVDLDILPGETMGLVGESGCGKTTLGRCIARLLDTTAGEVRYRRPDGREVDLIPLRGRGLREYRQQIRVIFQDPFSSLNPRMTLQQIVGEPLRVNGLASGRELEDRVASMLSRVGLRPEYMRRYPHAFSGGERQRINIARALITEPRLVIADEPVSALDVSVRAQILNLLADLQSEFGLTYLFISHDLSVVEHISDRVTVMYLGKVVESAPTAELYQQPSHPYTEALMRAVPVADVSRRRKRHEVHMSDDLPDPASPPPGCRFHTRCRHAQLDRCSSEVPELRSVGDGQHASCHFAGELALTGVDNSASPSVSR